MEKYIYPAVFSRLRYWWHVVFLFMILQDTREDRVTA
jgi:hypothetical protein